MALNTAQDRQGHSGAQSRVRLLRLPTNDASLAEDLVAGDLFTVEPIEGDRGYEDLLAQFERAKLVVSVSTETAFRCALSHALALALAKRLDWDESALEDMEIATQEAIGNAVLHGNLALPTLRAADSLDLERRIKEIETRLNDPAFSRRRVTVACDWTDSILRVDVCDEGDGFQEAPQPVGTGASGGGRGLGMIRRLAEEVAYDPSRRCVRMTFAVSNKAGAR